jgi:hypothetical protein
VLTMLRGAAHRCEWAALGARARQRTTPPAGGRRLVTVDGKALNWPASCTSPGAANITAALRHHAQRPQRALQTLKTR